MTSLSGVANRYVQLSPGADSNPELPENAVIPTDKTTTIVDLDQFFNTLDPKTSEGLRNVIRGFGAWYAGRGYQGNQVAKYFAPSLAATRKVRRAARGRPARAEGARPRHLAGRHDARRAQHDAHRPRHEHEHDARRDRRRERGPRARRSTTCRRRCAAAARRSWTCARRSTTSTSSSPRRSRRRRTSRRSSPSCARCSSRRKPTVGAARQAPAPAGPEQRLHRPAEQLARSWRSRRRRPSPRPSRRCRRARRSCRSSARTPPDLVGWFRDFGQSAVELRRQRPLRPHRRELQRLLATTRARTSSRPCRPPSGCPASPPTRRPSRAARAARPRRPRTAARRGVT